MFKYSLATSRDKLRIRYFPLESAFSTKPVLESIRDQRTVALIGTAQLRKKNNGHLKTVMERVKRVADVNDARMVSIENDMFVVLPKCTTLTHGAMQQAAAGIADDTWPEDGPDGSGFDVFRDVVAALKSGMLKVAPRTGERKKNENVAGSGKGSKSGRVRELEEMKRMINGFGLPDAVVAASDRVSDAGATIRKKMFIRRGDVIRKMHACSELLAEGYLKQREYGTIKSALDKQLQQIDYVLSGKRMAARAAKDARRKAKKQGKRGR